MLAGFRDPQLCFQLAPPSFQAAGHLGKEVVAILDPRPDVAGAVLQLTLALKVQGVEQHFRHRFGILLRHQPASQVSRYSLIREQFLQINSNKQAPFG